jgi:hypothetical protein
MMKNSALIITSIANSSNEILKKYASKSQEKELLFIVIGDLKSPDHFDLPGCSFYSLKDQERLAIPLVALTPKGHYSRKNIGYLLAIQAGKKIIIETDDDNIALDDFWRIRDKYSSARFISNAGWVNAYKYFSTQNIWPRGFALEEIQKPQQSHSIGIQEVSAPIQQGLANGNPDVDAIYRLIFPLPFNFDQSTPLALQNGSICPFNSQNTTWFEEAFPLMYLPSYCSFRMTDIWRSFIAQRIAWTCDWPILFHSSTVFQERNQHSLIKDFSDEISGYLNNHKIVNDLMSLDLPRGEKNILDNMRRCYGKLIDSKIIEEDEMDLVNLWLNNF